MQSEILWDEITTPDGNNANWNFALSDGIRKHRIPVFDPALGRLVVSVLGRYLHHEGGDWGRGDLLAHRQALTPIIEKHLLQIVRTAIRK